MTPRSPAPPTATGLPSSDGSSRTSTEAKKASRSTCRIGASSTVGLLEVEFNASKGFAVRHPNRTTSLLSSIKDDVTNGLGVAGQLRGVREDGLHFRVNRS